MLSVQSGGWELEQIQKLFVLDDVDVIGFFCFCHYTFTLAPTIDAGTEDKCAPSLVLYGCACPRKRFLDGPLTLYYSSLPNRTDEPDTIRLDTE